jgi:outer membrane protein TolC
MDQAANTWTLGLAGLLPIFNKNRGPIAEAEARREQAAARVMRVQSVAIEEVDHALATYQAALAKSAAVDTLYADRQAQERAAGARFAAGEISRLELGSLQLELASADLARLDARAGVQHALGQLEDALQSPAALADWLSIAPSRTPASIKDPR